MVLVGVHVDDRPIVRHGPGSLDRHGPAGPGHLSRQGRERVARTISVGAAVRNLIAVGIIATTPGNARYRAASMPRPARTQNENANNAKCLRGGSDAPWPPVFNPVQPEPRCIHWHQLLAFLATWRFTLTRASPRPVGIIFIRPVNDRGSRRRRPDCRHLPVSSRCRVILPDHRGTFFADHDCRGVCIAGRQRRHHRRIDDTQPLHPMHP